MLRRRNTTLSFFCALLLGAQGLDYGDLEAMGADCPDRNRCTGYQFNKTMLERGCRCDPDCATFGDCCMDAEAGLPSPEPKFTECLNYALNRWKGVYAVSRCADQWNGPEEIREKCEGPADFRDPVAAAPVTSRTRGATYRNVHCAVCNGGDDHPLLEPFHHRYFCRNVWEAPREEILKRATYNETMGKWGVNIWWDNAEHPKFEECEVFYEVPAHLSDAVRFCRPTLVSDCAPDWTDPLVRASCREYTSVVYHTGNGTGTSVYGNPHCALCNREDPSHLSCPQDIDKGHGLPWTFPPFVSVHRKKFSFEKLIYIGRPCPEGEVFDSFAKKCRKLVCALPGFVIRKGSCVRGD